jgi:hypothetical protein
VDKLIVRSMGLVSISDISIPTFKVPEICIEICNVQKRQVESEEKIIKDRQIIIKESKRVPVF